MLYAKMAAIAVFAFGFAIFLIFQFSPAKQNTTEDDGVNVDTLVTQDEIGKEVIRLMSRKSDLLLFVQPQPILESPVGDMVDATLNEIGDSQAVEFLEKVEWVLTVAKNPITSNDYTTGLAGLESDAFLADLVAVIRFKDDISDSQVIEFCQSHGDQVFSKTDLKGRLFLENAEQHLPSIWRLDSSTFLLATADRIRNRDTPYTENSSLHRWIKKFQTETIYDDIVIVSDLEQYKKMFTKEQNWGALRLFNLATVATFEINFTKQWLLICRIDTLSLESAFETKKLLSTVWHRVIGAMMEDMRNADPNEDQYLNQEGLKIIKSLTISRDKRQVIIGMPQPDNLEEWVDKWYESQFAGPDGTDTTDQ